MGDSGPAFRFVIITCLSLAQAISVGWSESRSTPSGGLRMLSAALYIQTAAFILFALQGVLGPGIAIFLGDILIAVSYSVFRVAVMLFKQSRWREHLPGLLGPVVLLAALLLATPPSDRSLTLKTNGVFFLQTLLVLHEIRKEKQAFPAHGRKLLSVALAFSSFVFAVRVVLAAFGDMLHWAWLNSTTLLYLSYASACATIVLVTNGFLMLAKERSEEQEQKSLMTDRLTGCWNRARIEQVIQLEMERAPLQNWPLSLLLLDIDHFKKVNDQHGHLVGDEILKEFASVVYRNIRSTDLFGRWGGEEFLLFPTTGSYLDALKLAERIRASVEQHRFAEDLQITISIGAAPYDPALCWTEWMKKVDLALYKAKHAGRNQVWTEQGPLALDTFPDTHQWKMQLAWKNVYECGYREIDKQHRNLLERVNQLTLLLHSECMQKQTTDLINAILRETESHFSEEEKLLASLHHEIAREHCKLHVALLEKARRMTELYFSNHIGVEEFVQFYGYELIVQHTLVEDLHVFRKIQTIKIAGKFMPS